MTTAEINQVFADYRRLGYPARHRRLHPVMRLVYGPIQVLLSVVGVYFAWCAGAFVMANAFLPSTGPAWTSILFVVLVAIPPVVFAGGAT